MTRAPGLPSWGLSPAARPMAEPAVAKPALGSSPAELPALGDDSAPPAAPARGHDRGLRAIVAPTPGVRHWLPEVWRFRSAIGYFLIAFMRKRTGRTLLGYFWLFIPVLLPLLMSTLVFGGILNVKIENGVPYFVYILVASSIWGVFAQTAYFSTRSLEITRSDLSKMYIPRMVPWFSAMSLPLTTFFVFGLVGVGAIVYFLLTRGKFYLVIEPVTLLAPVAVAMVVAFGLACGLWFSPVAPRARDVRRTAGYVLSMWYLITPVIYPIEQIPSDYRFLAELNPVTAPVELFKTALINIGDVTTTGLLSWAVGLVIIGGLGVRRFLVRERRDVAWYY
jgi:lipopolysaccharide transport system permease protein